MSSCETFPVQFGPFFLLFPIPEFGPGGNVAIKHGGNIDVRTKYSHNEIVSYLLPYLEKREKVTRWVLRGTLKRSDDSEDVTSFIRSAVKRGILIPKRYNGKVSRYYEINRDALRYEGSQEVVE